MKIALFGRTDKGGMKTHVLNLKKELSKKHDVRLLSQDDFTNINLFDGRYYFDIFGLKKIKEMLEWCDIMHVHVPSSTFEFLINFINKNKPIVSTFHFSVGDTDIIFDQQVKFMNVIGKKLVYLFGKVYSKKDGKVIVVGGMLKDIVKNSGEVVVITNGINIDEFKKIKTKRYFKDFTIGYVGRVDREKNVETLIKACKELNINLVVAGIGKWHNQLKKKYENDKILFAGKQEYPPIRFYNAIDVFCSPSFIEANISLTTLEAMACEKPVIVSGCGGEEKDIHESFGIFSNPDKESLKKSIKKIMKSDLEEMGRNARKVVEEKFDIRTRIIQIENLYKKLIKDNTKKR